MAKFGKTELKAAGVTFKGRQGYLWNLKKVLEKDPKGAYLTLRREPNNEVDENAVAIIAHVKGGATMKIGYVPKNKAIWIAPAMDAGRITRCSNLSVNGGIKKDSNLGVRFQLAYELPERV